MNARVPDDDLPDDLADRAAERLLAVNGAARTAVLAELIAAFPDRASALRALCNQLAGVEQLLDAGFPDPATTFPEQIGGHRVVRRLGEGAFGIVYLCQQQRPVVRQVAIKVLRPGAGDPKTLQRFAAERQLLAQLNHPGITQFFDAGELPDGRPFFVMEYVDGTPLHAWCVDHALTCAARLQLFVDVCRAVAHAHARGIVHRDLKPANVLVVETAEGPVPKVIDFGIAKAVGGGAGDDVQPRTEAGRVIGTPGYMSPEQAAGRIDQVDERADVFSLGVMLYELLTDRMPWPRTATASDTTPLRPSQRVTTVDRNVPQPAPPRHKLAAELRGDLDWITLKALARDRAERYARVVDLAADIERHLRGETVSVGPPSFAYRTRKFVRRNRTTVIAAIAIAVVSAGAVVFTERARRDSAAGLADSRAFVARLLQRSRVAPDDAVRRELATEALAFADRLSTTRSDDIGLLQDRCEALNVVAEIRCLLGELGAAREASAQAISLAERLHDAAPDDVSRRGLLGDSIRLDARTIATGGKHDVARERYAEALNHLEACAAASPRSWQRPLAMALAEQAAALPVPQRHAAMSGYERALALFDGIRTDAEERAATQPEYVLAMLGLARANHDEDRYDEALRLLDRIADELASSGYARLRATSQMHFLRGQILWERGDRETAIPEHRAAAAAAEQWCREQPRRVAAHRQRVMTLDALGNATNYVGDFEASDAAYRAAIAALEAMLVQFPDDPVPRTLLCRRACNFAYVLRDRMRRKPLEEAMALVTLAFEHDALLGDEKLTGRVPRWQLLLYRAGIEESRGDATTTVSWRELATLVPLAPEQEDVSRGLQIEAFTGIAKTYVDAGEPVAALPWLARGRAIVAAFPDHKKRLVEIEWQRARIAFLAKETAEAVVAADLIMKARPTWFGWRRAADCMRLAAACSPDPETAAECRGRAATLYHRVADALHNDVAANPDDPWFLVPWGAAMVRLGEIAEFHGDAKVAREQVEAGLEKLEIAKRDAQFDQWEEDTYRSGLALRERLAR